MVCHFRFFLTFPRLLGAEGAHKPILMIVNKKERNKSQKLFKLEAWSCLSSRSGGNPDRAALMAPRVTDRGLPKPRRQR